MGAFIQKLQKNISPEFLAKTRKRSKRGAKREAEETEAK